MDEARLEHLTTNNPAVTAPAATLLDLEVRPGGKRRRAYSTPTTSRWRRQNRPVGEHVISDPAGDEEVKSSDVDVDSDTQDVVSDGLSKYDRGWRRVVRNFSPSWFSTTMGTGIVSLLLAVIPWHTTWLYWLAVIFLGLNAVLFTLAFGISVLRYTLYPQIWTVMINDPTNSLFLGTATMGFATIVTAWVVLCCPYWGDWSVTLAWALWMFDSVAAVAVTTSLSFLLMSSSHQQSLDRITAAQLLPIASTIVAAGTGARVSEALLRINPEYALGTMITSYIMWGMSTPLALTVLVMYYQRLALHKLPPREIIVSSFLPLGPLGMGGYAITYLGKVSREVFPRVGYLAHVPAAADILYIMGMFIALIMWGFGLMWGIFAIAAISKSHSFPFNMGWWGFTFPLGVFAISTITFGVEMPSLFFRVLGTVFAVMVMLLWIVVAAGTVKGAWTGQLFYAPCLKNLPASRTTDLEKGRV